MTTLVVDITLLEPVLVTAPGGDPQTSVTCRYLPGSQLRGLVIGAWLRQGNRFDAADPATRRLFLDGRTRYLNAYPLVETSSTEPSRPVRALPRPLSWHLPKGTAPDHHTAIADRAVDPGDRNTTWAPLAAPFVHAGDLGDAILSNPAVQTATHVQRDRVYGRSREGSGALYRTEALAPGQAFQAAILCDDPAHANRIADSLKGQEAWLGGSRGSGYGRVKLTVKRADAWTETPTGQPLQDGRHVVTLLSDTVVRDAEGQSSTDPATLCRAIEARLGCPAGAVTCGQAFVKAGTAGGFNRAWGLPLPQEWCFLAGTTLVVSAPADLDPAALLAQGIGERRAEGFGRVGWDRFTRTTWRVRQEPSLTVTAPKLAGEAATVAEVILRRVVQKRADEGLVGQINAATLVIGGTAPPNSQIQRLRAKIQECLAEADPVTYEAELRGYLGRLETRASTRGKLAKCQVAGQPLDTWLMARLDEAPPTDASLTLGGVTPPDPTDPETYALRLRLRLRLMDQVLARIAKQARRERRESEPEATGGTS